MDERELQEYKNRLTLQIQRLKEIVDAEEQSVNKPKVDSQGRILSVPDGWDGYVHFLGWDGLCGCCKYSPSNKFHPKGLENGSLWISRESAQAEVTRRKCIQRLRGMDGYMELRPHQNLLFLVSGKPLCEFRNFSDRDKAEASITEEERAAFNYEYEYKGGK